MSNLDLSGSETAAGGLSAVAAGPVLELFAGRQVALGPTTMVRRVLPNLGRRMVGPWCFVDHYGPDDVAGVAGMAVPPHPHIGLQTVSWLLAGRVQHNDSLGSAQEIGPGELGLMTAGSGIAHAEYSPVAHPALLHGAQLWVALPSAARDVPAEWAHHRRLPVIGDEGLSAAVIMGELAGLRSPGRAHWPIVGVDVDIHPGARARLPLEADFEHAALVMSGSAEVDGVPLAPGSLLYLGCSRSALPMRSDAGARLLLLGGQPFEDRIVMWWNFVAGSHEEIVRAREDWMTGDRFGAVAVPAGRLPAPPIPPGRLSPRGPVR